MEGHNDAQRTKSAGHHGSGAHDLLVRDLPSTEPPRFYPERQRSGEGVFPRARHWCLARKQERQDINLPH